MCLLWLLALRCFNGRLTTVLLLILKQPKIKSPPDEEDAVCFVFLFIVFKFFVLFLLICFDFDRSTELTSKLINKSSIFFRLFAFIFLQQKRIQLNYYSSFVRFTKISFGSVYLNSIPKSRTRNKQHNHTTNNNRHKKRRMFSLKWQMDC